MTHQIRVFPLYTLHADVYDVYMDNHTNPSHSPEQSDPYAARVAELEDEGLTTSDAQGVADAETIHYDQTGRACALAGRQAGGFDSPGYCQACYTEIMAERASELEAERRGERVR